jgi:alpha-tubulin suppressor-like RCC1 family protein
MNRMHVKAGIVLLAQLGIFTGAGMAQVADPTIAVGGGTSSSPQTALVTLSDTTSGATLYYTTNGTTPTANSASVASGQTVLIAANATLKVQAYSGANYSNVISTTYATAGAVSAGTRHTLVLQSNGTVWATGDNTYGELGNGDSTGAMKLNPVQVMESSTTPLTSVVSIAAGTDESFAVDSGGNVWAWGYNSNGQLGNGTTSNLLYATQIATLTNIIGIATSQYHTLALQSNGTVYGWGADQYGQAGTGTTTTWVTTPTPVANDNGQSGNLSGIVAVATGSYHSLAIDNQGQVWSWGYNSSGQLGDDDSTLSSQSVPVAVVNNATGAALANAIGISGNAADSFAICSNGGEYAWGDNSTGELGTGNTTSSVTAVQVQNLGSNLVASGNEVVLDSSGLVWPWGSNSNGQLGIGYTGYYSTLPLQVNPLSISSPTLTVTSGNGQTVTDGTLSSAFTVTSSAGAGSWVNLVLNPTDGALGLSSAATELSPIIGGTTGSGGTINFYLNGSATGTVTMTATSGSSQTTLSAVEQMLQSVATSEPTMPQWMLIIMGALLVYFAVKPRSRITG